MPIPDLPGELVPRHSDQELWLKAHVARMCHLDNPEKFPGSQPVSFGTKDLLKLEKQDYWVCEKSDGVRVLFLVLTNLETNAQRTFIVNTTRTARSLGIYFPHHENPIMPLRSSLIDGELVIDVDPVTRREKMRFLAFDCLVINDENVMSKTLDKRYGRLTAFFYKPYAQMMLDHPRVAETQPFSIKVKEINFSYHVEKVFAVDIPALQHENDGLIYTCIKVEAPSENSIDFKLVLRFPPSRYNPSEPDWHAKPLFLLHQYDDLYVEDKEWEELKKSGEQVDDRIVEVHWDPSISRWRMMRFRNDKPHGNHKSVVENILESIADGVEKEHTVECDSNSMESTPSASTAPITTPYAPASPAPSASSSMPHMPAPRIEFKYGPLAPSRWSKVSGPLSLLA
ncbi:mRNA guanylyltransferase [Pholiota molesta]|nr:mRNA guanylyltransferase [Pholiota molesta]